MYWSMVYEWEYQYVIGHGIPTFDRDGSRTHIKAISFRTDNMMAAITVTKG